MLEADKQIRAFWRQDLLLLFPALLLSFDLACLTACAQLNSGERPEAAQMNARLAQSKKNAESPPPEPIGIKEGEILLAYPRGENSNRIEARSTFLVGAIPPGKSLSLNSEPLSVNQAGFFSQLVKLNFGKNIFRLKLEGQEKELLVAVDRPAPQSTLTSAGFKILPDSLEPKEDLGLAVGDIVEFAARATPGSLMSVQVGNKRIPMRAIALKNGKAPSVNLGLATAFGVSYQKGPAAYKDLYFASYRIQAQDNWQHAPVTFVLQQGKKVLKVLAKGKISILNQPVFLRTAHDNTIVRLGPGAARTTPLPRDLRMLADGWRGEFWRLLLCGNRHVWINKEDMVAEEEINKTPSSRITTINLESDAYGARIALPLSQRLPFQIEQDLKAKTLVLRIFGATADTDFVTSDLKQSGNEGVKLVESVTWKQKEDAHYELTAQLYSKQAWGFYADYEDSTLVLHIKAPPKIDSSAGNLKGAIICVDPGHGGRESGSIGCSGAKEARINLEIGTKLAKELEALGANVVLSRSDDSDLSLQARVDTAIQNKADLLLSVHNNALPDGRDPQTEKGTSSYWYHPQSTEIARLLQKTLVKSTGFKDYGSRYQNLALCRPTQMPATLLEIGFMINPDEFAQLIKPEFQLQAAKALAQSVKTWMIEKTKLQESESQEP